MTRSDSTPVSMPGGYWLDGVPHREAILHPMTGEEEAYLSEQGASLSPAHRTSILLARCVTQLGNGPSNLDAVRELSVGDREALLLHIHRMTFGERLLSTMNCPFDGCREKMDLELKIGDLLLPPYKDIQPDYQTVILDEENGVRYRVHFRLPTGADQEAAVLLAKENLSGASALLLTRCVKSVIREDRPDELFGEIPSVVKSRLPDLMAHLDPQAEIVLDLKCPACGREFQALFDAASYLYRETAGHFRTLFQEIHLLAYHYHWSEREILEMTSRKRKKYLELLGEELRRGEPG